MLRRQKVSGKGIGTGNPPDLTTRSGEHHELPRGALGQTPSWNLFQ